MKLSMEIPTAYLSEFSPLCEVDFALAQEVLEDKRYAEFYAAQVLKGRKVILDNGFHELGRPLDIPSLLEAAAKINPSVIIAPDWLGDAKRTFDAFEDTHKVVAGRWPLGVVLCGDDAAARNSFFAAVKDRTRLLCLPFKENRLSWFQDLVNAFPEATWPQIHLLGVNELLELLHFRNTFTRLGISHENYVSVDTGKPFKWGSLGHRFAAGKDLRGAKVPSVTKIDKLTPTQKQDVLWNIAFLRKYL